MDLSKPVLLPLVWIGIGLLISIFPGKAIPVPTRGEKCPVWVQSVKSRHQCLFTFFQKRVVNITILEMGPVPNESSGNFTYYRGIL